MQRYKLTLQYNGTPFSGSATRKNAQLPSVCSVVEGVHALANVAHVDILRTLRKQKQKPSDDAEADGHSPPYREYELQKGLNYHLKDYPIVVTRVERKDMDWDARLSAVSRSYFYRLVTGGDTRTTLVFHRDTSWHCRGQLDIHAMQRACRLFQGTHDFSCFGKDGDRYTKTPIRTIDVAEVEEFHSMIDPVHSDHRFYQMSIQSRAFMYHQVRYMVGALVKVGQGEWSEHDILRMLEADPKRTPFPPPNMLAPAQGLFLREVHYDDDEAAATKQDKEDTSVC